MPKPREVPAGVPSRMPEVIVGFSRIERNAVLVAGDVGASERRFGRLAGQLLRPQIDQHEMIVGAAGDDMRSPVGRSVSASAFAFSTTCFA